MSVKVPIRAVFEGSTATGLAEYQSGEWIALSYGGLGASLSLGTANQVLRVNSAASAVEFGSIVTTGALDSGSITSGFGAIDNGTSNIRSATITAETAFVPDVADGASLGTDSLEFSDLFLADGGTITLGNGQDVTITHVADTGINIKNISTSGNSGVGAVLTLQTGDTDIAINNVLGQIDFQAPNEGAASDAVLVAASISAVSEGDFSSSNNATKLSFKTGASEVATEKMSLSSGGNLTVSGNVSVGGDLDVTGSLDMSDANLTNVGSIQLDSIAGDGDTNSSITFSGSDVITIATGGTTAATFNANQILTLADDLNLTSDAAVISFGVNSEVTLTHVHNVGLTLTHVTASDNLPIVLQLKSEEDAVVADEVIGSIEFAAGDSDGTDGATVAAGIHAIAEGTFSASANATKLVFTTGVSETAAASATAKMSLSSAGLLTIADDLVIKTGGTIGGANDTDLLTLTSGVLTVTGEVTTTGDVTVGGDLTISGDDLTMATNTAGHLLIADGTNFNPIAVADLSEISTVASGDTFLAVDASGGGLKKITRSAIVSGLATSSAIANLSEDDTPQLGGNLDMNGSDIVTTSNATIDLAPNGTGIVVVQGNTNSGAIKFNCESNSHGQTIQAQPHSATVTNTMLLPAGANSTLVSLVSTDTLTNKTLTSPLITTNLSPTSADGAALGSASKEFSDLFLADASTIQFGDNQEITLTHVHNVGLTLTHVTAGDNLPVVLQLKSEEDVVVADEVIASLEFAAGDSDGTDGATVAAGIHAIAEATFSASANATKLVFTTGVSETAASSATAKATLSSIGDFQVAGDLVVKDDGLIGSASDLDAIAIASNGVVTFSQIPVMPANSIDSDEYIDGSIDRAHLSADIIDGTKIADDAIDSEHYTNGSIDTAHIAADQIVASLIADDAINSEHYTDGSIDTAHIADNQVTLAKMAGGTDGNIISFDASGDPVAIATGSDGQVLTSAGAGAPPAFENAGGGSASGDVKMFAGADVQTGWLLCNGAAVSRSTYSDLFSAISTTWGTGDGSSTFNVPDLRGRAPVGVGTGTSLTERTLAATTGTETHTLSTGELAAHTHTQNAHTHTQDAHNHTQDAHNHTVYTGVGAWPNVDADNSAARSNHGVRSWTPGLAVAQTATNQAATATNQNATAVNQNAGGGGAHNNMPPVAAINFIIKT